MREQHQLILLLQVIFCLSPCNASFAAFKKMGPQCLEVPSMRIPPTQKPKIALVGSNFGNHHLNLLSYEDNDARNDNDGIGVWEDLSGDEISEESLEDIESGAPSSFMIMKEILGINSISFVLAGLIVVMLSLNTVFGPGWLGQSLGLPHTGTFSEVSDSLPSTMDLNGDENLLL